MAALKPHVVTPKAVLHVLFKARKVSVGVTPPGVRSGKVIRGSHESYSDNTVGSCLFEATKIHHQRARLT
jgi:hypothetical protein